MVIRYLLIAVCVCLLLTAMIGYTVVNREKTSSTLSGTHNRHLPTSQPSQRSAFVENLLFQPESKIDVGMVALTLAKEICPNLDVALYSARIDDLADQVRRLAKETIDPDQRIRCLNTVLLLHEKFTGTRDMIDARQPQKYFLNNVLDTKQGNCFTMPFLYMAVGQRLGWPIYAVSVPDHSFVRYVDPRLKEQNIETTSNGGYVRDDIYARDFRVSEIGRKSGAYMRTLSYHESLGDLVAINGIQFGELGQLQKAVAYLELAIQFNPKLVGAWMNLANANKLMARRSSERDAKKYLEMADICSKKLAELGFVDPKDVPEVAAGLRPI